MNLSRRGFLGILGGLIAAPLVVRASSLMDVVAVPAKDYIDLSKGFAGEGVWLDWNSPTSEATVEFLIREARRRLPPGTPFLIRHTTAASYDCGATDGAAWVYDREQPAPIRPYRRVSDQPLWEPDAHAFVIARMTA